MSKEIKLKPKCPECNKNKDVTDDNHECPSCDCGDIYFCVNCFCQFNKNGGIF